MPRNYSTTENLYDLVARIFGKKQHLPPKSEKDVSFLLKELCSLIDSAVPKESEVEVQRGAILRNFLALSVKITGQCIVLVDICVIDHYANSYSHCVCQIHQHAIITFLWSCCFFNCSEKLWQFDNLMRKFLLNDFLSSATSAVSWRFSFRCLTSFISASMSCRWVQLHNTWLYCPHTTVKLQPA